MDTEKQAWIGLVGVTPVQGRRVLSRGGGAYVNAIALAGSQSEFERIVQEALTPMGFTAYEFEDVETFADRTASWAVSEDLQALADEVAAQGGVRFGRFHSYLGLE